MMNGTLTSCGAAMEATHVVNDSLIVVLRGKEGGIILKPGQIVKFSRQNIRAQA